MRVVEPSQFKRAKSPRSGNKLMIGVICVVVAAAGFAYWKLFAGGNKSGEAKSKQVVAVTQPTETAKKGTIKQFSGEEFKQLYRSVGYPNTQAVTEPPEITGNIAADDKIRAMADARGYHTTSIPVSPIVKINEPRLEGDDLLQPLAAAGWAAIKESAHKAGYPLSIISAYRSPEYQRNLFVSRLLATSTTPERIAAGLDTDKVAITLNLTAVPGYSRHHTGYTADFWCEDGSGSFLTSKCYKWISDNNYLHAKENGWIPSYPADTKDQGPEPEPWEYVWVGRDKLTE